jgi:5'-3' exonuclease
MLNTFLRTKCSSRSISKTHLKNLQGMRVAVDTSIYMYRFIGDKALTENFYLMCSLFRRYNITPIFIFEGKPPKEKNEELEERKKAKKKAEKEYYYLKNMLEKEKDILAKQEIELKMDKMRKKFIRIKNKHIKSVKVLFQNYGMSYVDAPGESDVLCAYFSKSGIVDACLSEDMDMFVYGCPIILRYFSLLKHNCVIYNMNNIIDELQMTHNDFKTLCIVSGTDYSKKYMKKTKRNIFHYYGAFIKYKNYIHLFQNNNDSNNYVVTSKQLKFIPESAERKSVREEQAGKELDDVIIIDSFDKYLNQYYRINIEDINNIQELFDVYENEELFKEELKIYSNIPIHNSDIHYTELKKQLEDDNFVFID